MTKQSFIFQHVKVKYPIQVLFLFVALFNAEKLSAQMQSYNYRREISGISDTWHSLTLPNEVYQKMRPDLLDMRILGITAENDTIEAPFLRTSTSEMQIEKEIPFKLINGVKREGNYYFTFEMPSEMLVNQIVLDFAQSNFDWKVKVEGSQNQMEWFTTVDNYRILGIENAQTKYKFTNIVFPDAKFRYFRVCINSTIQPEIVGAKVNKQALQAGEYKDFAVKNFTVSIDKNAKQSIIALSLPTAVPISYLKFAVKNSFDYYRPMTVQYLADSTETEKGYIYQFNNITSGTLSSLEKNEIKFPNVVCKNLKIIIDNADNEPLQIESVEVKGSPDKIVARFTQKANYYLVYGNENGSQANYDIAIFQDKIPKNLTEIQLAEEQTIVKVATPKVEPLFQNKVWLWGIMGFVIVILGWFSFKMIKNKQ